MMRRLFILTLYVFLIIYTLIHLIFFYQDDGMLIALLSMNADPMLFMMFNLLGLFPFAFLLHALKAMKLDIKDFIPLGLGFMLGGFAIAPLFIFKKENIQTNQTWIKWGSIFGGFFTIIMIIYGLVFGSFNTYIDAFLNDSFIHIMTLDFLFLVVLTITVLKPVSKYYYLGIIPVVGLYLGVLFDYERI